MSRSTVDYDPSGPAGHLPTQERGEEWSPQLTMA